MLTAIFRLFLVLVVAGIAGLVGKSLLGDVVGWLIAKDLSLFIATWSSNSGHLAEGQMGVYIKTYALPFALFRQIYAETRFLSICPSICPPFVPFAPFARFHVFPSLRPFARPFAPICPLPNS